MAVQEYGRSNSERAEVVGGGKRQRKRDESGWYLVMCSGCIYVMDNDEFHLSDRLARQKKRAFGWVLLNIFS